jgi:hypothetical protein
MPVNFTHKGNFNKFERFLTKALRIGPIWRAVLNKYGKKGVEALAEATPIDTGKTAESWSYDIVKTQTGYKIVWKNSNIENGVSIAILLQYGHGTRNGGYVEGTDYINPAVQSIFQQMAKEAWKEVTSK